MNLEEAEEMLSDIFINGFSIEKDKKGRIIVITGLTEGPDGELVFMDDEDHDEDLDMEEADDFSIDEDE